MGMTPFPREENTSLHRNRFGMADRVVDLRGHGLAEPTGDAGEKTMHRIVDLFGPEGGLEKPAASRAWTGRCGGGFQGVRFSGVPGVDAEGIRTFKAVFMVHVSASLPEGAFRKDGYVVFHSL